MTDEEAASDEGRSPVLVFMDRVKFLIKTDEHLTVIDCVGALHIIAHELAMYAISDEEGDKLKS
jgi:hypothetical protein